MIPRIVVLIHLCLLVITLDAIPIEVLFQRNIPVEVRYEGQVVKVIPREVQARRNLDAKVQLDSEELKEALKHLPIQTEPQVVDEGKPVEKLKLEEGDDNLIVPVVLNDNLDKPQLAEKPEELPVVQAELPATKSLLKPENDEKVEDIQGKAAIKPSKTLEKVLQESHQIIRNGLKNLRESFKPGQGEFSPSSEQWESLEKAVETYFDDEKQKLLIRQTQQGSGTDGASPAAPAPDQGQSTWIQNIVNGFNGIATNFVQSIQNLGGPNNGAPAPQGQGDEGAPAQPPNSQGFQGFIQFFNNGISNIVSTITGSTNNQPPNNNLSDPGSSPSQPSGPVGFFGAIVTNVQNALGLQQGQPAAGAQGDTGAPVQTQQNGPLQVIQSVGNQISSFFTGGTQNRPPSVSGDEGAAPAQSSNTNIIQNIQNAIQNSPLNPFRPQGGTNNPNPNPVQNAIQSIGTQAQQLIPSAGQPGQPQSPDNIKTPSNEEKPQPEKPLKENEISKKATKTLPLPLIVT